MWPPFGTSSAVELRIASQWRALCWRPISTMGRYRWATKFLGKELGLDRWAWGKAIFLSGKQAASCRNFLSKNRIKVVATAGIKARGGDRWGNECQPPRANVRWLLARPANGRFDSGLGRRSATTHPSAAPHRGDQRAVVRCRLIGGVGWGEGRSRRQITSTLTR